MRTRTAAREHEGARSGNGSGLAHARRLVARAFLAVVALGFGCKQNLAAAPDESRSPATLRADGAARIRNLDELVDKKEPGIELVRGWIRGAKNPVEELSVERAAGERALLALQVTSRSPMGAVALETGGLLVDHGWIRVLGGGNKRLPRSIHEWNRLVRGSAQRLPGTILVGDDVLGGFFAINGGGLNGARGHVFYHSPQSLAWEDVAPSYSEWLVGIMIGDLEAFYKGMRWLGWHREVEPLTGDRAINVYPFLFASGEDVSKRSRRPVPLEELWGLLVEEAPGQLGPPR
jgi:hypothetical protein